MAMCLLPRQALLRSPGRRCRGLGHEACHEMGWCRRAKRKSHHAVTRHRWRWRCRDEVGIPDRAQLALRHGSDRQRFLRCQYRRGGALPLSGGRDRNCGPRRESRRPARWSCQLSLDQEHRHEPRGSRLFAAIGSNSNAGENGMAAEEGRAAIVEIDPKTGETRPFATGLRNNPVGLAWQPDSGALWVAVNERDELGSDLVPDYMTAVKEGGFYG